MKQRRPEIIEEEKRIAKELRDYVQSKIDEGLNYGHLSTDKRVYEYLYKIFSLEVQEMGYNSHKITDNVDEKEKKIIVFRTLADNSRNLGEAIDLNPDCSCVTLHMSKIFNDYKKAGVPVALQVLFHELEHIRQKQMVYSRHM